MTRVINLRTVRKQAARDGARKEASGRAARHGVSKLDRALDVSRAEKAARDLDGHKRET